MAAASTLALLLIGAPGAGKSEALTRVHDEFDEQGTQSAAIDTDELARSCPPISLERHLDHLRSLANSYLAAGQSLLLVAATIESDEELSQWLAALDVDRHVVVHLVASPPTLEARIREREPTGWRGLPELLASAARLADLRFPQTDLELSTEEHGPESIARAIASELADVRGA